MEDTEEVKIQGDTDKQIKVCVRKMTNEANKVKPRWAIKVNVFLKLIPCKHDHIWYFDKSYLL